MEINNKEELILVALDSKYVYIQKSVFIALFENSHIYYKKDYNEALKNNRIKFSRLEKLSREAGIPYSLFFAPIDKVEENIKNNNNIIFSGVTDVPIVISSRGDIRVRDINLIIKDIQKRQQFLTKKHPEFADNPLLNLRLQQDPIRISESILNILKIDMDKFRSYSSKELSYNYLISRLEDNNILISRSRIGVMPQTIKTGLNFSGFLVKHRKFPALFLHPKDEDKISDPSGRRIFTIFLLLVCIVNKKYAIVTYSQNVREPAQNIEYLVAEEILMPESMICGTQVGNLNKLKEIADLFKVTPSMAAVRLRRLGIIHKETFDNFLNELELEWDEARKQSKGSHYRSPKDLKRVIDYNGMIFTKEVMMSLKGGELSIGDATRLLMFKKKRKDVIYKILEQI